MFTFKEWAWCLQNQSYFFILSQKNSYSGPKTSTTTNFTLSRGAHIGFKTPVSGLVCNKCWYLHSKIVKKQQQGHFRRKKQKNQWKKVLKVCV